MPNSRYMSLVSRVPQGCPNTGILCLYTDIVEKPYYSFIGTSGRKVVAVAQKCSSSPLYRCRDLGIFELSLRVLTAAYDRGVQP